MLFDPNIKPNVYVKDYQHLSWKLENVKYIFKENPSNKTVHVSELIGDDWFYKWVPSTPIFISAQTGTGKNYFVQNELIPKILEHNRQNNDNRQILVLSNRIALNYQNKLALAKIIDRYSGNSKQSYVEQIQKLTDEQFNNFSNFGSVKISSYHQLLSQKFRSQHFDFVVIDECHFFTQDSTFNADTEDILDFIINQYQNAVRIYISATLDDVLPIILTEEQNYTIPDNIKYIPDYTYHVAPYDEKHHSYYQLDISEKYCPFIVKINPRAIVFKHYPSIPYSNTTYIPLWTEGRIKKAQNKLIEPFWNIPAVIYDLEPNYDYIKTHIISKNDDLEQNLIDTITNNKNDNSKWIVFVKSKDLGKSIEEALTSKNISTTFISSDTKDSKPYKQILTESKFNVQVLITTAVIDNGVNIKDPTVTNIIISIFDYVSFIQMLGRIRRYPDANINLYLYDYPVKNLEADYKNNYTNLLTRLTFENSSTEQQEKQYKHYLSTPGFALKDKQFYFNALSKVKLVNNLRQLLPLIEQLDTSFATNWNNNLTKEDYDVINTINDIYEKDKYILFSKKLLQVLDIKQFSPQNHSIPVNLPINNTELVSNALDKVNPHNKSLSLEDELLYRQYVYLWRIDYFLKQLKELNEQIKQSTENGLYTEIDNLSFSIEQISIKVKKYIRLFNDIDLSFNYEGIPYSPIIYHQLLWLEKFKLDVDPSEKNMPITKEILIKLLEANSVSKDEYNEAINSNSNLNNLLQDKGFLAKDKDNTDIYCKIQEYISSNSAKKDCKSASKINEFFKENNIPFKIQSLSTRKKTYWLITKLNS